MCTLRITCWRTRILNCWEPLRHHFQCRSTKLQLRSQQVREQTIVNTWASEMNQNVNDWKYNQVHHQTYPITSWEQQSSLEHHPELMEFRCWITLRWQVYGLLAEKSGGVVGFTFFNADRDSFVSFDNVVQDLDWQQGFACTVQVLRELFILGISWFQVCLGHESFWFSVAAFPVAYFQLFKVRFSANITFSILNGIDQLPGVIAMFTAADFNDVACWVVVRRTFEV